MSDLTPTRSAVIALGEERRAMRDSYVFLDEKCLLLAQGLLRELRDYERLAAALGEALGEAARALHAALARHGLEGLQRYPAADLAGASPAVRRRSLMGVAIQEASLAAAGEPALEPVNPSPEAEACRKAHATAVQLAARVAALWGNLERLYREYRRTVRRVRALQDVLLPEVDRDIAEIETSLEELERDEAVWLRHRPGP